MSGIKVSSVKRFGAGAGIAAFAFAACLGLAACGSSSAGGSTNASSQAASTEAETKKDLSALAVGDSAELSNGLTVTVNSVEGGLTNYDGSSVTCVNVTYSNGGDKSANFNLYDWKAEDTQGAQRNTGFYTEAKDQLDSGSLAAGGTVTGNIYFDGDVAKVLYFDNMLSSDAGATWVIG